jgi:hypothetical protein
MTRNVGSIDRTVRVVSGLVLVGLAATGTVGWWSWLGMLPLATGLSAGVLAVCGVRHQHLRHARQGLSLLRRR